MNIQFQDLSLATPKIKRRYIKNSHRSISATFRFLRRQRSFSFFGDYPILSIILQTIIILSVNPSRYQTIYALNQSEELRLLSKRDKNCLINQLVYPLSVAMKSQRNRFREVKKQKTNNQSSKEN